MTFFGKLLQRKSIFLIYFAIFCRFLAIFTFFGAFSLCTVGAFLAVFPIFLGFVGIFWGTPANYFADFGAILAIFDHFWAIFGPLLGIIFFLAFFAEKWHFGPGIRRRRQKTEIIQHPPPTRGEWGLTMWNLYKKTPKRHLFVVVPGPSCGRGKGFRHGH